MDGGLLSNEGGVLVRQDGRPSAGPFHASPRLWRSDGAARKLEPLVPSLPQRATVTFNEDRAYKRDITVTVTNPEALRPKLDYVLAELQLTDTSGVQRTFKLGHFLVDDILMTVDKGSRHGEVFGWDATSALGEATIPNGVKMPAGANPGAWTREFLLGLGIPAFLLDIRDSTIVTTADKIWDAGETWLTVANEALNMGNMYTLWTTGEGRLRSWRYSDPELSAAVAVYGSHRGAYIVPPLTEEPNYDRLRNRVTVRKVTPDEPTIYWTAEVTDQTSPLHPMRLAQERGVSYPVILAGGGPVDDPDIVDQAAAKEKAEMLLADGASYYRVVTIETFVDEALDGHQTVELAFDHLGTTLYRGLWRQRTWSMELRGATAKVRRELNRVESYK